MTVRAGAVSITQPRGFARGPAVVKSFALAVVALSTFCGCAFNPAPVGNRPPPPSEKINYHEVAPGENLFAIAWRYEKDLDALARVNGLLPPYHINSGRRLLLDTSLPPVSRAVEPTAPPRDSVSAGTSATVRTAPRPDSAAPKPRSSAPAASARQGATAAAVHKLPVGDVKWRWPATGDVSRYYDASRAFKGINIIAAHGQPVLAAANGVVVYAGNGLRGYGNLVIVKHSSVYLSAYAHNKTLLVKEGDTVAIGNKIAVIGGDPANRNRLYFEIRKRGKPVDPMRLLPRQ